MACSADSGDNDGVKSLGHLEAKIMDVLWDDPRQPLRVRDVLDRLGTQQQRAYTTVMTVLDNLHRKGWVTREVEGKGYVYLPAKRREEAAADAIRALLDATGDPEAVLTHFAQRVSQQEVAALRKALNARSRKQ